MVRIKGENSDYRYSPAQTSIEEVKPPPDQLYLNLFLCPYDHPSRVEPHAEGTPCCLGTDHQCPEAQGHHPAPGHALIRLDQKTGISLVSDHQNQINLSQDGTIQLCPPPTGQVEIHNALVLLHPDGQTTHLEMTPQGLLIHGPGGSQIRLDTHGNLELTPGSGTVKVNGNLSVTGQINAELSPAARQALLADLKRELGVLTQPVSPS
ncbi:MAG TPA: hypothetical protein V6D06_00060 [Trichocoleus sp.]